MEKNNKLNGLTELSIGTFNRYNSYISLVSEADPLQKEEGFGHVPTVELSLQNAIMLVFDEH